MYRNTFRGRGRGRGGRRLTPYGQRNIGERDGTIPRPTPDQYLAGGTSRERAISRAKDDLKLANDWKTYFEKLFERGRYSIPRPMYTHLVPEADTLNTAIDKKIQETKDACKIIIEEHLNACIGTAETNIANPPETAEKTMLESVTKLLHDQQKETLQAMIATMAQTFRETMRQSQNN